MEFPEDFEGVPPFSPKLELWIKESVAVNNGLKHTHK